MFHFTSEMYLPSWIAKLCVCLVAVVGIGLIYYGVLYGIIRNEIAYTTKAGNVGTVKTFMAVILGTIYSGLGVALLRVAVLIFRNNKN